MEPAPVWPSVSCSVYYWLHFDKFKHRIGRPTQMEHVRKWNMLFLGDGNSLLKDQAREKPLKKTSLSITHKKNLQTSQFDQELLQDQVRWRKFTFVSLGTYLWWLCNFISSLQPWRRTKTFCITLRKPTGSSLIKIMNLRFSDTVLPHFRNPWQKTFCSLFSV